MPSKIAVDYTASYLAGEFKKRPVFLTNVVLKSVLMNESIGEMIVPSYLNGHYFRNKRYLKWVAKPDGYNDAVGLGPLMVLEPMGDGLLGSIVNQVKNNIDNPENKSLSVSDVQVRQITAEDYADQYIKEHRPELANRNYSCETTNTNGTDFAIYVAPEGQPAPELPDPVTGIEEVIHFSNANAKVGSLGVVAKYTLQKKPAPSAEQSTFIQGTEQSFPEQIGVPYSPTSGFVWDGLEHTQDNGTYIQQKKWQNYFEIIATGDIIWISDVIHDDWPTPKQIIWKDYRKVDVVHAFDADYPTDIVTVYEVERIGYEVNIDPAEWEMYHEEINPSSYAGYDAWYVDRRFNHPKVLHWFKQTGKIAVKALHADVARVYIYALDSGDLILDDAINTYTSHSVIEAIASPPRPLVINHTSIDELGDKINVGHKKHFMDTPWDIIRLAANNYQKDNPNPAYKLIDKAVRKQTQRSVKKVLKEVKNHEKYGDMSYVYYFDGVPINTRRKYLTRYVYEYFRGFTSTNAFDVNDRIQEILDYNNKVSAYYAYLEAVEAKERGTATAAQIALADGPEVLPPDPLSKAKTTEIRWGKDNDFASWIHYSLAMRGEFGSETVLAGTQLNPYFNRPAKKKEAWITTTNHAIKDASKLIGHVGADITNFYYQEDANTCRTFSVVNLELEKWVWRWGYVITTAAEAMEDPDESKFFCLILNQPLKNIGLVPATQVLVESPLLEIDVYVQKKNNFLFKQVVGFVISVIASVLFPPAGGYYFGLTGVTGAVATVAVNMVVGAIIATAATKIFGGVLGSLIGAVATMGAMRMMAGGTINFQTIKNAMGDMQTLLKITDAVSDAFKMHMVEKVKKMQGEFDDYLKELKKEKNALNQLMAESGISELGGVDGTVVMKALNQMFWGESPENFLSRTMMSGTELVQQSLDFVNRFTENNLYLE